MLESLEPRLQMSASLSAGELTITGTAGSDHIAFSNGRSSVTLISSINGVAQPDQTFALRDIVHITANLGAGDDTFIMGRCTVQVLINGGDGDDVLSAGFGNDQINGGSGEDYLFGNDGRDTVDGGLGADELLGGAQKDVLDYSMRTRGVIVTLGTAANDGELLEFDNAHTDFETVLGSNFADIISTESGRAVEIYGNAGNDTLTGGSGKDMMRGGDGLDVMFGMGGDDVFFSFDGQSDIISGGGGVNTMGDYDSLIDQLTGILL